MKKLIFLFPLLISAQNSPIYPARISSYNDLGLASENFVTALSGSVSNAVTTIGVATTTGSLTPTILYLDPNTVNSESIFCLAKTTNTFTSCTRGFNGTTAINHNISAVVSNNVSPYYVNQHAAELISVETDLINGQLSAFGKFIVLHNTTPITGGIPVYVSTAVGSPITPSTCTIISNVLTCSGAGASSITLANATHFVNLGAASLGKITFCDTCTVGNPCAGSGGGAWAFSNASTWNCPF